MTGQPPTPAAPAEKSRSSRKVSNSLVALSSAAVLAVYTAGYLRTKPAADRFDLAAAERRSTAPAATLAAPSADTPPPAARDTAPETTAVVPHLSPLVPARPRAAESPDAPVVPEPAPAPAPGDAPVPEPPAAIATAPAIPLTVPDLEPREAEPAPAPAPPPRGPYADGTYTGWGYSRHGDIEATVVVESGRIVSADISQCRTRYSCNVVDRLPGQILSRQRAAVDVVSGATESAYAFEDAVIEALAKAK